MGSGFNPIWSNHPAGNPGLDGDSITKRGCDPNAEGNMGADGSMPIWKNDVTPDPSTEETPNSVSGLPKLPSRFTPNDQPEQPPSLQDRSPGTIDRR